MADHPWQIDDLDLAGYLARVGVAEREPSRGALDELHEAHVRTFTFDNIDVLLGTHAGVTLEAVQGKFVGCGRGGMLHDLEVPLTPEEQTRLLDVVTGLRPRLAHPRAARTPPHPG